jgi:aspartate dehydrogenase
VKTIGIVGCGTIGRALVAAAESSSLPVRIAGITSRTEQHAVEFLSRFKSPPPYLSLPELIGAADLLVEAAGGSVVPGLAKDVFAAGKDLMVISVGALLDHPEIIESSRRTGCRLYIPSGAIAGLDGIKSACVGWIEHVTMTTRKPPDGLEGAPHLVRNHISLAGLAEEMEVFSGTARERFGGGEPGRHRS